jgi:hypothetical protein
MKTRFLQFCVSFFVLVLASSVASCTTTRTIYRPAPKVTSSTRSANDIVSQAASAECAQFASTYSAIQAGTQGAHTVGALVVAMNSHGNAWARSISKAAKVASRPGVPTGGNQARVLAVDLDRIALDLDEIRLDISLARYDKINKTWNKTISDLGTMQAQCG